MAQLVLFRSSRLDLQDVEWACFLLLLLKGDPGPKGTNFKMTDFSLIQGNKTTKTNYDLSLQEKVCVCGGGFLHV